MASTSYGSVIIGALVIANFAWAQQGVQPTARVPEPEPEPYVIEGGGVSIQPWYWLTSAHPRLRPGAQSTAEDPASLTFPGDTKRASGFVFALPAGKQNTLRLSYFRAAGSGDTTASTDLALFSVGYVSGDYLTTKYKLQNVKLSWDYLSYTFASGLRLKTLWEAQLTSIDTTVDAPYKEITTDSDGYPVSNQAVGNKWLLYPTFGLGLEHAPSRRFRWEAKASGFGVPHYGAVWDVEASAILRLGKVEMMIGEKAFSVKTSPKGDAYFNQRLSGAFVGLRWYLDRPQ